MLIKHFEVERQRSVGHRKTGGRGCEMPWELKGKSRWGWGGQREIALGCRRRNVLKT